MYVCVQGWLRRWTSIVGTPLYENPRPLRPQGPKNQWVAVMKLDFSYHHRDIEYLVELLKYAN